MSVSRTVSAFPVALLLLLGLSATAVPAEAARPVYPMAGISFQGAVTAGRNDTLPLQVSRPADTVAGDVLVARVANSGDASAGISAPGWTAVGTTRSAHWLRSVVLVRVVAEQEPDFYTFTTDGGTALVASISAYSGVDPGQPVENFAGEATGFSTTLRTPVISTSGEDTMAVWLGVQLWNGATCPAPGIDPPQLYHRDLEGCVAWNGSPGLVFSAASRPLPAPGPVAPSDGSSTAALTNVVQVVTLRAARSVVIADRYAPTSVDVGDLWSGRTGSGGHNTAVGRDVLHEPSGLAVSRRDPGIAYVHSESDVPGMVAVRLRDAAIVGRYRVSIPHQWDWEDIAVGPCPAGSCVYAGDIGRANGKANPPSTFAVYRVAEPELSAGQTTGALRGEWFRFRYPDGPKNAEALMVHPRTGAVYVITKAPDGASGVYAFPGKLPADSTPATVTTLTKVAVLSVPQWDGDPRDTHARTWAPQVTAATIHPAGDRFLVRTPYAVWEYRAPSGGPFEEAFTAAPVKLTAPTGEAQGESIDYATDGSAYYTVGERKRPPYGLNRVDAR